MWKRTALVWTLLIGFPVEIHGRSSPLLCLAAQKSGNGGGKRKTTAPTAGGFASVKTAIKSTSKNSVLTVPPLSSKAKKLLQRHGNNVDAASNEFFITQIQSMLENHSKSPEEIHAARVAAAWDSVALFLPQDYARSKGKVEPHVERRLRHIVQACLSSAVSSNSDRIRLLDVGCGDGALLNYLPSSSIGIIYNNQQQQDHHDDKSDKPKTVLCEYVGIDISSEMIDLGLRQHPNANLRVGCFPECMSPDEQGFFDVILFNGSLQFFRDTRHIIQEATRFLTPRGRLVLCHVNGAKFVREECLTNPSVAVRNMPNQVSLQNMAELLGMKVLDKAQVLEHNMENFRFELDGDTDQFYLEVLELN